MTHPLEKLAKKYLDEKSLAPSTKKSYAIAFKNYIAYLKARDIIHASTGDIILYKHYRKSLGHSSYYIYIDISALKGFYRYLKDNREGLNLPIAYAYNIMETIKNERIKPHIKKHVLTAREAKMLLLHTKTMRTYLWHYRDHAMIMLMITSGLRPHEIMAAKRSDFCELNGMPILYIGQHTNHALSEWVKVSKGTKRALDDYLSRRTDDNPYLFIAHRNTSKKGKLSRTFFKDMMPRVLKEAGLEGLKITPHALRHTAATLNLIRGASLLETKSLMRHTNIESTLIYQDYIDRLNDESERLIDAFLLKEEALIIYQALLKA
ncbi:MAG: tyrosine-type recombinase/integrase, partial [Candidatus Izemoplasmataceae bacterium]